jgi:hypothetical protein
MEGKFTYLNNSDFKNVHCSRASSVTPGYRLEPIPLRSHLNLACEFEESISGSFTLDNQVNKNLNGSNGQLSNNHNESFHHDGMYRDFLFFRHSLPSQLKLTS